MRGEDSMQEGLFSYVSPESRIPRTHPLRPIRAMMDSALSGMDSMFRAVYSDVGRPSIPPEKLLRALLLQVLYTIRSERLLMEQLDYNLLFRWFVGLSVDEPVWDHSTFSKSRNRLFHEKEAPRDIRVAQDCRRTQEDPLQRPGEGRLAFPLCAIGLQHGADEKPRSGVAVERVDSAPPSPKGEKKAGRRSQDAGSGQRQSNTSETSSWINSS